MTNPKENPPVNDSNPLSDKPPFFHSWKSLYIGVMLILFILVGLFYIFSAIFA